MSEESTGRKEPEEKPRDLSAIARELGALVGTPHSAKADLLDATRKYELAHYVEKVCGFCALKEKKERFNFYQQLAVLSGSSDSDLPKKLADSNIPVRNRQEIDFLLEYLTPRVEQLVQQKDLGADLLLVADALEESLLQTYHLVQYNQACFEESTQNLYFPDKKKSITFKCRSFAWKIEEPMERYFHLCDRGLAVGYEGNFSGIGPAFHETALVWKPLSGTKMKRLLDRLLLPSQEFPEVPLQVNFLTNDSRERNEFFFFERDVPECFSVKEYLQRYSLLLEHVPDSARFVFDFVKFLLQAPGRVEEDFRKSSCRKKQEELAKKVFCLQQLEEAVSLEKNNPKTDAEVMPQTALETTLFLEEASENVSAPLSAPFPKRARAVVMSPAETYGRGVQALREACLREDQPIHPGYTFPDGSIVYRPYTFKENILARLEDFEILKNSDGEERSLEERLRLFRVPLSSCTGFFMREGLYFHPKTPAMIGIKPDFDEACLSFSADLRKSELVLTLDPDCRGSNYRAWRILLEDDPQLLNNYLRLVGTIKDELASPHLMYAVPSGMRAVVLGGLGDLCVANGRYGLNRKCYFLRKVNTLNFDPIITTER